MADVQVTLRDREVRPLSGTATAESGTLTVLGAPAPTLTLTDAAGQPVPGFDGIPVSGYTNGTAAAVSVYFNFDAGAIVAGPGVYTLTFSFVALGSDGLARTYEPTLAVKILPPAGTPRVKPAGYPTGDDLRAYVASLGVIDPDELTDELDAMDPDAKVAAAREEFERRTGWTPSIEDATDQTRYFDPPGPDGLAHSWGAWRAGGQELDLAADGPGLLSLTELRVGVSTQSDGDALVENEDFFLKPYNAALNGRPFESVLFASVRGGAPRSIRIAGRWGFGARVPEDVWQAVLHQAAFLCYPEIALAISRGLYSSKDQDHEVRYGSARGPAVSEESRDWRDRFEATVSRYMRVVL